MAKKKNALQIEKELAKEVKDLSKQIERLKGLEFVKVLKHPGKLMWLSFLKGVAVGFGSVLGATVVVAIFIYILSQISFVPIVGDFIKEIQVQLEQTAMIKGVAPIGSNVDPSSSTPLHL